MARDENWKSGVDQIVQNVKVVKDITDMVKTGMEAYQIGKYLFDKVKENMPEIKQKGSETINAIREYCDKLAKKIIKAYDKALKTVQDTTKAAKKAVDYILS